VARILIQEAASWRLDEIYRYTCDRWGTEQADRYITGLFESFDGIETHQTSSRPIPAEFGIEEVGSPKVNFARTQARKQGIVDGLVKGIGAMCKGRNVEVFNGVGSLGQGRTVSVSMADGSTATITGDACTAIVRAF